MTPDWRWASDYLSKGRKKYERTLYDRGLRMTKVNKWDPDSDIAVGWNGYGTYVIYHQDGTTTIQAPTLTTHYGRPWSPLKGYSVRFTMERYAGVKVIQRKFKFYVIENDPVRTPSKIQGCRTCSQSGLVDSWCSPMMCWDGIRDADNKFACEKHSDAVPSSFYSAWHYLPCHHGKTTGHTLYKGQTCYSCKGNKKREYGNKPVMMMWDGSPLKIQNGKIIKTSATLTERMLADYVEPIG